MTQFHWLEDNSYLIGAGTLVLAGAYQFTPLKYMCLDKCRSPLSFITQHWSGGNERWQAVKLGVHHGIFCVGCCWSLMLLMFAVGVGNIGVMMLLGGSDGGGEEHAVGTPAERAAGNRPARGRRGVDHARRAGRLRA